MALSGYLKLKGKSAGEVEGSATRKGREGWIEVIAVNHEIVAPRDPASGKATGKRQHKPFIITKELDKATPILYSILCSNEEITDWELQFWSPSDTGDEVQHYTVKLKGATISSIQFKMHNNRNTELARYNEFEEISYTYKKIEWTWNVGGAKTAEDDWDSPKSV
jgi:type VI secretion system secreted protein Hcp